MVTETSGGRSDIAFIVGRAGLAGAALGARGLLLVGFRLLGAGVAPDRGRQSVERNALEIGARAIDRSDDVAWRLPVLAIAAVPVAVVAVARIARSAFRAVVAFEALAAIRPLVVALVLLALLVAALGHFLVAVIFVAVVAAVAALPALLLEPRAAFAEHPVIMVGVLQIIFGLHAVAAELRVARHALLFFQGLRRFAGLAVVLAIAVRPTAEILWSLAPTAATAATLSIIDQIGFPSKAEASPFRRRQSGAPFSNEGSAALTLSFRSALERLASGRLRRGLGRDALSFRGDASPTLEEGCSAVTAGCQAISFKPKLAAERAVGRLSRGQDAQKVRRGRAGTRRSALGRSRFPRRRARPRRAAAGISDRVRATPPARRRRRTRLRAVHARRRPVPARPSPRHKAGCTGSGRSDRPRLRPSRGRATRRDRSCPGDRRCAAQSRSLRPTGRHRCRSIAATDRARRAAMRPSRCPGRARGWGRLNRRNARPRRRSAFRCRGAG